MYRIFSNVGCEITTKRKLTSRGLYSKKYGIFYEIFVDCVFEQTPVLELLQSLPSVINFCLNDLIINGGIIYSFRFSTRRGSKGIKFDKKYLVFGERPVEGSHFLANIHRILQYSLEGMLVASDVSTSYKLLV